MGKTATDLYNEGYDLYEAGDHEGAIKLYTEAIEAEPSHPNLDRMYASRGYCRGLLQDPYGSIDDLSEAIQLNPSNAHALSLRGGAYLMLQEFDKASADLEEAYRLEPEKNGAKQFLEQLKIARGE